MKQIRIIGLAMMAVFAFSAIVASAAQAGEYGRCEKVKKTGAYEEANCNKLNATHTGNYEWAPVVAGENIPYTSKTKEAILDSAAGKIKCKASTDVGAITGPKSDTDRVTFTGCTLEGVACQNVGGAKETIITNLLDTSLLDFPEEALGGLGLGPAVGEAWTQFVSSEHEPYQAEFECAGILLRVSGSVAAPTTPVLEMTKKSTLTFNAIAGAQDLVTEFSVNGGVTWEPLGHSEELIPEGATVTGSEKLEIKT